MFVFLVTRHCPGDPRFCEYQEGDSNIIIVSTHGGKLKPKSITDRDAGCLIDGKCVYNHKCDQKKGVTKDFKRCSVKKHSDKFSRKISLQLADLLDDITGKRPHLILSNLHRIKMDASTSKERGSFSDFESKRSWEQIHKFIKDAKVSFHGKRGLLIHVRGTRNEDGLNMIGYGLEAKDLRNKENQSWTNSSIQRLADLSNQPIKKFLFGETSLGGLLEEEGYPTMPSPEHDTPGENYLSGDYITDQYGSKKSPDKKKEDNIDAIQIAVHEKFTTNEKKLRNFVKVLARVIAKFVDVDRKN